MPASIKSIRTSVKRLGSILEPSGVASEEEGVLNPASVCTKEGHILLYPRCVAKGNHSRIGIVRLTEQAGKTICERLGYALEPSQPYELDGVVGSGCADARVTYIAELNHYVMGYTAHGKQGPRGAIAYSTDGRTWQRIGLIKFPKYAQLPGGDTDIAFFPEPVVSPSGVKSLAFYHRPMALIPSKDVRELTSLPHAQRDSIWIAYVPLVEAKKHIRNLIEVGESHLLLAPSPSDKWGQLKLGGGTAPLLIDEGWLSVFYGVDVIEQGGNYKCCYKAGILVHDVREPHKLVYRSADPILQPEMDEELVGTVNNVVFPTGLLARTDLGKRVFDIYYGMADYKIGLARLTLS
jgi:predicted GH43/DUF377 family glycosyl hydrolase